MTSYTYFPLYKKVKWTKLNRTEKTFRIRKQFQRNLTKGRKTSDAARQVTESSVAQYCIKKSSVRHWRAETCTQFRSTDPRIFLLRILSHTHIYFPKLTNNIRKWHFTIRTVSIKEIKTPQITSIRATCNFIFFATGQINIKSENIKCNL
jgi:hypothetical protein